MATQIKRVSDLSELSRVYPGMKVVVAYQKANYIVDLSKIQGRKIDSIYADQTSEPGARNAIYIKFEDGKVESFYVYNGSVGNQGKEGIEGVQGNQGEDAYVDTRRTGIIGVLEIVNNSTTLDPSLPWSAFRGKDLNERIYDLNEIFLTDEEYVRLFENISFIYAEFKTSSENQDTVIFNADPNPHTEYIKYWTYEESALKTYYVYNPVSDTYDAVAARLWEDIYLGSKEGYFPATGNMLTDGTVLYYFDDKDNEYKEVDLVTRTVVNENDEEIQQYIGDKHILYYAKELDAYLDANYARVGNLWSFAVNAASEIQNDVYTQQSHTVTRQEVIDGVPTTVEEIEYTYTLVNPEDVDTTLIGEYYMKSGDEYIQIADIESYLTHGAIRYYYRGDDNRYHETSFDLGSLYTFNGRVYPRVQDITKITEEVEYYYLNSENTYTKIDNILDYIWAKIEEKDSGHLSKSNKDDYIMVSTNPLTKLFTVYRYHPEIEYGEVVYYFDEYTISDIDLYYYTTQRDYYDSRMEISEDENGNRTATQIYTLIEIPSWIYAEFITTEEDENTLILNSISKLGDEDNTEIDPTEEDTEQEVVENVPLYRIIPGHKSTLYRKDASNEYIEVNLGSEPIYDTSEYYIVDSEFDYVEVTRDYILTNNIEEFFYKDENNEYLQGYISTINEYNNFYLQQIRYVKVNDAKTYLNTYDLNLLIGEPQVLPITMYPLNTTDRKILIDYDPNLIKFFEDGRIAATIGESFETQLILSNEDNTVKAYINVKLITPMKSISVTPNSGACNIGDSVEFTYNISPEATTNKNIIWNSSDEEVASIELLENNTIKVNALTKGNVVISGISEDGFGANTRYTFESVQPAETMSWDQDNIVFVDDVLYDDRDVERYIAEHPDATDIPVPYQTVKIPAHYEMTVLLYKEYRLTPNIEPEDTSYPQIIWTSSNSEIVEIVTKDVKIVDSPERTYIATQADVDNNLASEIGEEIIIPEVSHNETGYFVKSYSVGSAVVTGHITRQSDIIVEVKINVNQSIERVIVTPDVLSMNIGLTKKLTYTTEPIVGTAIWSSEDPEIVSVSPDGSVKALSGGATRVLATATDGSEVFGVCTITATVPTKDINLNGDENNGIIYVGINNSTDISAEILYDENHLSGPKLGLDWSVTDSSILTISEKDSTTLTVTGKQLGKTTVVATAKDGSGVFGTIQVQVIKLAQAISFNFDNVEMDVDDTIVLIPVFSPIDTSNEIVIWNSSDETIAKVKNSGIVYALSSGECQISATTSDGTNLTAICNITVL